LIFDHISFAGTDCGFYAVCAQRKFSCDPYKGYPLAYGMAYCMRFTEFSQNFTKEGLTWMQTARKCLQVKMATECMNSSNCDDLERCAYDSHFPCYVAGHPNFCDIWPGNIELLMHIFKISDFMNPKAWKSIEKTLVYCGINPPTIRTLLS